MLTRLWNKITGHDPEGPSRKTFRRSREAALLLSEIDERFTVEHDAQVVVLASKDTHNLQLRVQEDGYAVSTVGTPEPWVTMTDEEMKFHENFDDAIEDFINKSDD